jgi:hypothetical protein
MPLKCSFSDLSSLPDGRLNYGFLWSRTRLINEISRILLSVKAWPAAVIHSGRDGVKLVAGVVFGNLKWTGELEVSFAKDVRDRLIAERVVECSSGERCADRINWIIRGPDDVERALWLLSLGYSSLVEDTKAE